MITLYQFDPAFGLPNASPFCMKVETYLQLARLPYQLAPMSLAAMRNSPKGKLPYIEDQGQRIGDSSFIIDYLKTTYGDPLDNWLTAEQKATALALQRMLEENTYWTAVSMRWMEDANWPTTRAAFFGNLPRPLRWIVPPLARRGLRQQLAGHGMGRHSREEIHAIARRDLTALADFLGDKPFMLGTQPCTLDAVAYAFLANLLWAPYDSDVQSYAKSRPTLEAYCLRMKRLCSESRLAS